ncbi:MAG: hypothetical protein KBE65_18155 [Phycisphaerae bacterium]|nr:hypothetical protein [Phycisphaerae bacterium]
MQVRTGDIHHDGRVPRLLAAAAVLLGVSAFAKVAAFYVERGQIQGLAGLARIGDEPNGLAGYQDQAKKAAEAIKQKNLFIKEPPKEHPIKQVDGILGDEAFIAGQWYKAGGKVGDAKIIEIGPTYVKVEWEGKEQSFAPIGAAVSAPSAPPPAPKEVNKEPAPEAPKPEAKAAPAKEATPEPVEPDDPLAWLNVRMSARLKAFLVEKWNGASEEEKARAKEEWNRMSDSDKQRAIDQMESHVDEMR